MRHDSPHTRLGLAALCALAAVAAVAALAVAAPHASAEPAPSPLLFSTYLGGFGADWPHAVDVGADGRVYVAGYTDSANFPTTPGAYRNLPAGGFDVYVACFSPDGSTLEWATLVGGEGEEMPWDIAVDGSGRAWVVGHTESADFPTSWGAPSTTLSDVRDAFVLLLSADGRVVEFSTFIGGEGLDKATGVALDGLGTVWVVGETYSRFFPTTPGVYDGTYGGLRDAFVVRVERGGIVAATYWGGADDEQEPVVAVDGEGRPCVAMASASTDIPYGQSKGARDAVLVRFDRNLTGIDIGRSVGGLGSDIPRSLEVGAGGELLLAGYTFSPDFPTTGTDFGAFYGGVADGMVFIVSAQWDAVELSLLLGGTNFDVARAASFDRQGHIVVSGYTNSTDLPVTADAYDGAKSRDDHDVFLMEIDPELETLVYGTYIGGGDGDYAMDMDTDRFGVPVVVAYTHSSDFPMGREGFDRTFNGDGDALALKFSRDTDLPTIHVSMDFEPRPETGEECWLAIDAFDDSGIDEVRAEYWFDDGGRTTVVLTFIPQTIDVPHYQASIDVPVDARALHLIYHARDGVGLENSTEERTYTVVDTIAPWLVEDRTPGATTTGGGVEFWAQVADNIGLGAVHLEHRQGARSLRNVTMDADTMRPGVYRASVSASNATLEPLMYRFTFQDVSGHWNWTAFRGVEVSDDDAPVLDPPSGPDYIEPSDEVEIIVNVSDNIGVVSARANYTFDGVNFVHQPYEAVLGGTIVLKLDVPGDERLDLFVEFLAYDAAGNVGRATMLVPNEDHTPPELVVDPVANRTATGSQVTLSVAAYDEWGIAMMWIRWWFGQDLSQLHESPGTTDLEWTIDIPLDSTATLHCMCGARDYSHLQVETPTFDVEVFDDRAPVADAGPDIVVRAGQSALLTTAGSSDNVGIVRCEWLYEDEETGQPATIVGSLQNVTFNRPGDHSIHLTIYDAANNTAEDEVTVTVEAEDGPGGPSAIVLVAAALVEVAIVVALLVAFPRRRGKGS